jgi:hypothetical protein
MSLVLPDSYLERERRALALEEADHIIAERSYWEPKLHDIDHRLFLRKCRPSASAVGLFPGMWHVIRVGGDAPFTAWVISTNGLGVPGGYREMGHDVLETLKRGDLWNPVRVAERDATVRRAEESKERARENHREARRDDLALNVKAMISPGVSRAAKGATAKARRKDG